MNYYKLSQNTLSGLLKDCRVNLTRCDKDCTLKLNDIKPVIVKKEKEDLLSTTLIPFPWSSPIKSTSPVKFTPVKIEIEVKGTKIKKEFEEDGKENLYLESLEFPIKSFDLSNETLELELQLQGHKYQKSLEKVTDCTFCSMKFASRGELRCHLLAHIEEEPFACKLCDQSFNTQRKIKLHLSLIHKDRLQGVPRTEHIAQSLPKPLKDKRHEYECTICGKQCSSNSSLENHIRSHTGEKPYKCPNSKCSKLFSNYFTWYNHQRRSCLHRNRSEKRLGPKLKPGKFHKVKYRSIKEFFVRLKK